MYEEENIPCGNMKTIGCLTILSALILFGSLFIGTQRLYCNHMQERLAEQVLRFHVIANSDSDQDQHLKRLVKEAVVEYFSKNMPQHMNIDETKEWARTQTDIIEEIARNVLEQHGKRMPVHGAVVTCYFSDRKINGVVFPAGNYETLRLEIGQARGHNWWCVLYPKFGFLDAVPTDESITVQSKFKIKWYLWEHIKNKW